MPYAKNGDINIYYEVEGEGQPLVLLHGLTKSLDAWRERGYVDQLRNNYKLILVDARGHGKSDKPHDPESYHTKDFSGDITAILDDLNIQKAYFFGYSMGGAICLGLAKYAPERVKALIIGGVIPFERYPAKSNLLYKILEAGAEAVVAYLEQAGPISDEMKARALSNDYEAQIAMLNTIEPSLEDDLPDMDMPCLVFVGEADELYPYQKAKEVYKKLPNRTFVSFPDLNHVQTIDRSDLLLPHVTEFLTRVSKEVG